MDELGAVMGVVERLAKLADPDGDLGHIKDLAVLRPRASRPAFARPQIPSRWPRRSGPPPDRKRARCAGARGRGRGGSPVSSRRGRAASDRSKSGRNFSATSRSRRSSQASQTIPMPPRPRIRLSTKRPNRALPGGIAPNRHSQCQVVELVRHFGARLRATQTCVHRFLTPNGIAPACHLSLRSADATVKRIVPQGSSMATLRYQHYEVVLHPDGKPFELGRGAMESPTRPSTTNLRSQVCLKVINGQFLHSRMARERFLREARAAARLRHQNVASVFHLGQDANNYFYSMESSRARPCRPRQAGGSHFRPRHPRDCAAGHPRAQAPPSARSWSIAISSPPTSCCRTRTVSCWSR